MTALLETSTKLTPDEIATIGRFVGVLEDVGFQAHLTTAYLRDTAFTEVAATVLGTAFMDISNTCKVNNRGVASKPENAPDAALSLELVVNYASNSAFIPDDFIPSRETLDKCRAIFFERARARSEQA